MPKSYPARQYLLAGLLYLAVVVLLFWKVLFSGLMMVGRDSFVIFYPWRHFLLDSYRQGIIPLWNPYAYSGQPFLANMHSGVLYPLNILLLLGPLWYSMAASVAFHIWMAGCFMYAFLRAAGSSHAGALFGGLVYLGSGWFVKHFEVLPHVITVAWTPLVFWCFERGMRDERSFWRNPYLYLGGVASGVQILSGHPLFIYAQFGLLIYALFRTISRASSHTTSSGAGQGWFHPIALLIGFNVLAALLAAAQLLPAMEYSGLSNRVNTDYGYATQLSLPPLQLLTMAAPYLFGNPAMNTYWGSGFFWLTCLYVGVTPLLLAVMGGIVRRGDLLVRFALALALASLLLTLGKYTPAYRVIFALPLFDRLRYPTMFILLYTFAVAILSAHGFESLGKWRVGRAPKICIGIVGGGLMGFLLLLTMLHGYTERLLNLSLSFLWIPGARTFLAFANRVGYQTALEGLWLPLAFLAASMGLLLLWNRTTARPRFWRAAIFLVALVDIVLFGMKLKPLTDARFASATTPNIELLRADPEPFRLWTYHRTRQNTSKFYNHVFHHRGFGKHDLATMLKVKDHLPYNVPMIYRFSSIIGYDSLKINRYRTFGVAAENEFQNGSHRLLDLLNTRYILATEDLYMPGLRRIRDGERKVYQSRTALPRAYLVSDVVVEAREKAIFNLLRGPTFDARRSVIFEQTPPADEALASRPRNGAPERSPAGAVTISAYEPNRIVMRVETDRAAYLVLSEINYPGWRVRVDGEPAPLRTANFVMRAVYVPAGKHDVEWVFAPWSVRLGAGLSVATSLALIILLTAWVRRRRVERRIAKSRHAAMP